MASSSHNQGAEDAEGSRRTVLWNKLQAGKVRFVLPHLLVAFSLLTNTISHRDPRPVRILTVLVGKNEVRFQLPADLAEEHSRLFAARLTAHDADPARQDAADDYKPKNKLPHLKT